ncbi:MAG: MoaD/ThiS family protein [Thiohalocapsa sp.]
MQITFKLFASLGDYLPADARANQVSLDIAESETVQQILDRYQLPDRLTHLVLINGVFIPREERPSRSLSDGDQLAVWPPIAGG